MSKSGTGTDPQPHKARSQSDIALAAAVAERGVAVSPWQVERWRQAGLLPAARRTYAGRPGGSRADYPPEAVDRVLEIASLVRHRHPLSEVALTLFARGRAVPDHVVKAAYHAWLDQLAKWLGNAPTADARLDLAEASTSQLLPWVLGTKSGRRMRRRLKGGEESPESMLFSTLTNLVLLLLGEEVSDEALAEILDAGGVSAMYREPVPGVGPVAEGPSPDVFALMRRCNLKTLQACIDAAAVDEIRRLCEVAALIMRFGRPFTLASRALGVRDAFGFATLAEFDSELDYAHGAAMFLLIKDLIMSAEGEKVLSLMATRTEYFAKLAALLQSLPKATVRDIAQGKPDPLRLLSASERERVRAEAAQLAALKSATES